MPLKISAFPKCYLETISNREMSVFDWIDMAKQLDADGLEMYSGFFESFESSYLERVGNAMAANGFAMPMFCCSPDFTAPDTDQRKREIEREAQMIGVTRQLGGPSFGMPNFERAALSGSELGTGKRMGDCCDRGVAAGSSRA